MNMFDILENKMNEYEYINEYEREETQKYEGTYTPEEIELNKKLYEECSKDNIDFNVVEDLLNQGADSLGATAAYGWDLLEHIYSELVFASQDWDNANLPEITRIFLKHGMNVDNSRIPYDNDNSLHPLWMFSFTANKNSIHALRMLLDAGLDSKCTEKFITHSIDDQINVHQDNPNDPEYRDWFIWTMKMIMLIASYDHIIDNDEDLRRFIGIEYNNYDLQRFRKWDDYYYEFDTSRCRCFPELYKSVIRIYEAETHKEIWKIGVCLQECEF